MAGLSQRFLDAGFALPKYMLYIGNRSLFNLSVSSFSNYFRICNFVFVTRSLYDSELFIKKECELLGIKNYQIFVIDRTTRGQAETVYLGLQNCNVEDKEPIVVFNIDTLRSNLSFPGNLRDCAGYLEVFRGAGANWSYAQTENDHSTKVIMTAEKKEISNYCSTGLYYFKSKLVYYFAYEKYLSEYTDKELYVAPIYNYLIREGMSIHIHLIDNKGVQFCGVPQEYYSLLRDKFNTGIV